MAERTVYQKLRSAYDLLEYLNDSTFQPPGQHHKSDVQKELLELIMDLENGRLKIVKTE
jgi:hypothetical protein